MSWAISELSGAEPDERQKEILVAAKDHGRSYHEAVSYVLLHDDYANLRQGHCTAEKLVMAINQQTISKSRGNKAITDHKKRKWFSDIGSIEEMPFGRKQPSLQGPEFDHLCQLGVIDRSKWEVDDRGYWVTDDPYQEDGVGKSIAKVFKLDSYTEDLFHQGRWTGLDDQRE